MQDIKEKTLEQENLSLAEKLAAACLQSGTVIATAESCTGGLISGCLTSVPGSSQWFERGFVTYTNQAKQDMLGVQADTLQQYGAVSSQTASQMAAGALAHSTATLSVAVTGIAGPDGGSKDKPTGTVWFGFCLKNQQPDTIVQHFKGDRAQVRQQTVHFALQGLLARAKK